MEFTMTKPCKDCPFLAEMKDFFPMRRLRQFADNGTFPCHKTAEVRDDEDGGSGYTATAESLACAGALIFNEKRNRPNQMMRIAERLGMYNRRKLDMTAEVR
jgi:hypothetical protein